MSDLMEDISLFLAGIAGLIVFVWLVLWLLCIGMYASASFNAWNRCYSRGYKDSEVVVNYPKFWHADTVCYKGEGKENGTKL